jgi:hypothetical protein
LLPHAAMLSGTREFFKHRRPGRIFTGHASGLGFGNVDFRRTSSRCAALGPLSWI